MTDISGILEAIITLIFAVVSAFVIPYIRKRMSESSFYVLQEWVRIAVEAAEMIYNGSGKGEEKKKYVVDFLKKKGFTFDEKSLEALIESSVLQLQELK